MLDTEQWVTEVYGRLSQDTIKSMGIKVHDVMIVNIDDDEFIKRKDTDWSEVEVDILDRFDKRQNSK